MPRGPARRCGSAAARGSRDAAVDRRGRVRAADRGPARGGRRRSRRRLRRPRARREPCLPLQPRPAFRGGAARPRSRQQDAAGRQGGHRVRADRPDRGRRRLRPDLEPDGDRPQRGETLEQDAARGGCQPGRPGRRRRLEGAAARGVERELLADLRARVLRRHIARDLRTGGARRRRHLRAHARRLRAALVLLGRPDRRLRVRRIPLLGVGDGDPARRAPRGARA